ncbi:MAG: DUF4395 domain-containing protein [Mycobacteriales bacterium]
MRVRTGPPATSAAAERSVLGRLLSFPDPVNEVSARLVAAGVVLMTAATLALDLRWMTGVLAYGFLARVLSGPTLSPLGQLVTRVVTPLLPVAPRPVPGPPKRFAQGVGLVFTGAALTLTVTGHWDVARVVLGVLIVPALLESALGFCLGCQAFALLMRVGVIPTEVCERCNNINLPAPADAA